MRAEGRLLVLLVEIAIRWRLRPPCRPRPLPGRVASCDYPSGPAVGEDRIGRIESQLLRHGFAQLDTRGVDAGRRVVGTPLPPEPAETEQAESPRRATTLSSGTPIISG
jgi:hypothetical protein